MDMIGHQAVSMNTYTIASSTLLPQFQIELVIFRLYKTDVTVVATLNDMVGIAWKIRPCSPWHNNSFVMKNVSVR